MSIWEDIALDANRGAERLISEFGDRLYASAAYICGNENDAEDLVSRTFTQVIRKISQYNERSSFYTCMYSIMLNFRKMDLRRKGANALVFPEELPEEADPSPDPAEGFDIRADAADVRRAVSELPEPYRAAVVMFYFEDMEIAEIAQAEGMPAGSVKSRLHRARKMLFKKLRTFRPEGASKSMKGRM